MTYDLLSDFPCCLIRHLPSFLGAGHLLLDVAFDGRWKVNDALNAFGLGNWVEVFFFFGSFFCLSSPIR